jgi:hypothetical protein
MWLSRVARKALLPLLQQRLGKLAASTLAQLEVA